MRFLRLASVFLNDVYNGEAQHGVLRYQTGMNRHMEPHPLVIFLLDTDFYDRAYSAQRAIQKKTS